nr:odorant receptor [Semanotus bifasciatus]
MLKYYLPVLLFIGASPERNGDIFQNLLFTVNICFSVFFAYLILLRLSLDHNLSLTEVVDTLGTLLTLFHGIVKLVCLYIGKSKLRDLLNATNTFHDTEHIVEEEIKAACLRTMKTLKILMTVFVASAIPGVYTFMIKPISERTYIFFIYIPSNISYEYLMGMQAYTFITTVLIPILITDLIFISLLLKAKVQFQLLNFSVNELFQREVVRDEEIHQRVKKLVDTHNFLLEFVKTFNKVFSLPLFLYFQTVMLCLCIQMFMLSIQKSFASCIQYIIYIVLVLSEFTILYCLPAQSFTDEVDKLSDNIWQSGWHEHPSKLVHVAVKMILMRSQRRTFISAQIVNVTHETCMNIVRAAASYYTFLKTIADTAE